MTNFEFVACFFSNIRIKLAILLIMNYI